MTTHADAYLEQKYDAATLGKVRATLTLPECAAANSSWAIDTLCEAITSTDNGNYPVDRFLALAPHDVQVAYKAAVAHLIG